MHWHKELRAYQREHQFQLFLRGVTRYMYIRDALVEDFRPLPEQTIDCTMHHFLVARYGCSRQDHCISRLDTYQAMILVSYTREGRSRFTLASCTHNHNLLRFELIDILSANNHPFRHIEITQFNCHLHIVDHTATNQRNKALIACRRINYLLDT